MPRVQELNTGLKEESYMKTFIAALAAVLIAALGLNAQPKLSDHAIVTTVPSLKNIPVCIMNFDFYGPDATKIRANAYKLGAREIGDSGLCRLREVALGVFVEEAQGPTFQKNEYVGSKYGSFWGAGFTVVLMRNGTPIPMERVAQASHADFAGTKNTNGLSRTIPKEVAIYKAREKAAKKLFEKETWLLGAADILKNEFKK